MAGDHPVEDEQDIARVLQTKEETRAFCNKIAGVYDLPAERSEQPMWEIAVRMLAPAPGERLPGIGFGTGHLLTEPARGIVRGPLALPEER